MTSPLPTLEELRAMSHAANLAKSEMETAFIAFQEVNLDNATYSFGRFDKALTNRQRTQDAYVAKLKAFEEACARYVRGLLYLDECMKEAQHEKWEES